MAQDQKYIVAPNSVSTAIKLMWASIAIGIPNSLYGLNVGALKFSALFLVTMVVTIAIMSGLLIMISKGKNWARIIMFAMYILGLFIAIPIMFNYFNTYIIIGIMNVLQTVLQLIGFYLLYKKESNLWFRSMKLNKKPIAV